MRTASSTTRWKNYVTRIACIGLPTVAVIALSFVGMSHGRSTLATETAGAPAGPIGSRIKAYLGLDIPPSRWAALNPAIQEATRSCMTSKAVTYVPSPDAVVRESDEERVANPVLFASKFGYGIAEEIRLVQEQRNSSIEAPTNTPPVDEKYVSASTACSSAAAPVIARYTAPTEVHQRYGALLQVASKDTRYLGLSARWSSCMKAAGVSVDDPQTAPSVVNNYLQELAPTKAGEGVEVSFDLTPEQARALQAYELRIFGFDQACRAQTGLNDLMSMMETELLETLRQEFPGFPGVHA